MVIKKQLTCKLCGYVWFPMKEKPKQCPNCKRYDYNRIIDIHSNSRATVP